MSDEPTRAAQIQEHMRALDLGAVVLRLPENILLVSGWFVRYSALAFVVVPADGPAVLVVPEIEAEEAAAAWGGRVEAFPAGREDGERLAVALPRVLGALADEFGSTGETIGFEDSFESVAPPSFFGEPNAVGAPSRELIRHAFNSRGLLDITATLEKLRAVKSPHELQMIRRTNEIAMFGLEAFKRAAVPGASEVEVMAAVEQTIAVEGHGYSGAEWVRGFATVASGPRLSEGWWYFRGSTRRIERDDAVMIELGTVADGYWSDHTRTVIAGKPSTPIAEAYAAVRSGLDAALGAARPGASGGEVDAASRAAVADHGVEQFPHHTGHGTGFRYHESQPALVPGSEDRLSAAQVIALEPGVYGSSLGGGVRHEDDAVVTDDGASLLATTDYGLGLE
jgi:Xaa-Pro dipeptidase